MRDAALLGARFLLGGYMGIHASQKLFGKFHGPGLEAISKVFEDNGLHPGREMALAASATEITGGVLTITGIADPVGPLAVAGAMAVAAAFNRERGLMAARNGVEQDTDRQADRQADRQTGRQADRQTGKQVGRRPS